jgi:hypothetical protein
MGTTSLLTDEEAELLAKTILENGDIQSVMEGLSNPDLAASAATLAENFNNVNPNNPESDFSKIQLLQKAADSANEAVEKATALKEEYEAKEEQRIADKIALDEIWAKSDSIEEVVETEISVTTGYDTRIGAIRKELTTVERRDRSKTLIYHLEDILNLITTTKSTHLPNGVRDPNQQNIKIWRYLDTTERMVIEIRNFDMANVILRSSFKVPVIQIKMGELINFYPDLEETNQDLHANIIEIYDKLSDLDDLMERYKLELSLL